ncbi:MAG TPA: hypothetical protein VJ549_04735 [Geothrix sp.]|nr:hypothetical protein [Geothrix sp.]
MRTFLFPALSIALLSAQEPLPMEAAARHLLTIAASAGFQGRVSCRDLDMSVALKKQGISTDPRSPIAWAASRNQIEGFGADRKLILCGERALLQEGAAIALVSEGGRLVIYLNAANAAQASVPVPESILRLARRVG